MTNLPPVQLSEEQELLDALQEAIDLLAERKYGSRVRSPGQNARLLLESTLAARRSSSDEAEVVGWQRHGCAQNGPCSDNGDGCSCSDDELARRASPSGVKAGVTEEVVREALKASADQYETARKLQASSPTAYAECFGAMTPPELAMRAALTAAGVRDEGMGEALARIIDANDNYLRHNPHGEPDALTLACDAARKFLPTPIHGDAK